MTYEAIRSMAGITGLLIFIGLFVVVLLYVFWPGNKARFERARHLPLENDKDEPHRSDRHGR
jgi:cytochrome c oxidase cbb3-type subunit IV